MFPKKEKLKIINQTKNTVIASEAVLADTMLTRMVGLLNRQSLFSQEALLITRCNSIHMFFMRFAIDVLFVDNNHAIVGLVENIKPFQLSRVYLKSSYAVELPAHKIAETQTQLGDVLSFA